MFTDPHVDLVPCSRCGLVPSWLVDEGPGHLLWLHLSCSYRCGGDDGVISVHYPDPERTPTLVRLRLVRTRRWRTPEQAAAELARRWNHAHQTRGES